RLQCPVLSAIAVPAWFPSSNNFTVLFALVVPLTVTTATLVIPSLALEPVSGLIPLIVTVGNVSSTANACVACTDWLPNWSVTCAVTVSVPSLSVVASADGIVAVQPVPSAFTVAVSLFVNDPSATVMFTLCPPPRPVTLPIRAPPPCASARLFPSPRSSYLLLVAVGSGSSTAKACVACTDWLPNWSVTCAVTVNVPSLSVVASAGGIVVVQPVPCAFTVAV